MNNLPSSRLVLTHMTCVILLPGCAVTNRLFRAIGRRSWR
jgi:hypothetical protein